MYLFGGYNETRCFNKLTESQIEQVAEGVALKAVHALCVRISSAQSVETTAPGPQVAGPLVNSRMRAPVPGTVASSSAVAAATAAPVARSGRWPLGVTPCSACVTARGVTSGRSTSEVQKGAKKAGSSAMCNRYFAAQGCYGLLNVCKAPMKGG